MAEVGDRVTMQGTVTAAVSREIVEVTLENPDPQGERLPETVVTLDERFLIVQSGTEDA